jgi:hypothetical protein
LIARSTIEAVLGLHAEKRDLAEGLLAGADIVEFDDEPDPDPADARGPTA